MDCIGRFLNAVTIKFISNNTGMKFIFFASLFLLNSFCLTAQTTENWYKVYSGKVGNLSAILHLNKAGKNYGGYIWFDQNQWPMSIYSAEQVAKTDSINISSGSGPVSLNLTGVFGNESFNGISLLQKEGNVSTKATFRLQVSSEKMLIPFDYFFVHGSAKLLPEIKNASDCDYLSATIWPTGNTIIDEALKKQIQQMLNIPPAVIDIVKWMAIEKNKFLNSWKKENSKLSPKEASEMGLSLSVQEENRVMIMYENERYITLAHYSFSFTGGAHGNYGTTLSTLNKQSAKKLQLSDVVNAAGIKVLPELLEQVARLQYGIKNNKPLDQNYFLVKKIIPTENFYVTATGIGFLYAPYEIKSFADGEVNLLVPFLALNTYLQTGFQH